MLIRPQKRDLCYTNYNVQLYMYVTLSVSGQSCNQLPLNQGLLAQTLYYHAPMVIKVVLKLTV